ncbi:DTW domain-containing protein [Colwellia sp. 1_MG-2023]|uniref:tRNA-uridine aminocarboxypropyltransferase n=1 Tax=Colwellia sp. 1_MG-2023 TaxID=3062649 RepID=UPI0026E335E3|nr:DTW domain-containing protein [Colwellia sp. 1_MG-2023]MDO6445821.1 DTW domain-containing protein [Colwellia sp. 1_MG-2023]
MHAVNRLFQYRKSISTTEYKSRGQRLIRCELCQLAKENCVCQLKISLRSNVGFLLLMYDTEVLKPSNTGKLIADLIPETFAFLWSRTTVDEALIALINDEKWQPYIVFPAEYAKENQQVFNQKIDTQSKKKPLFIVLDGSWREAKKIFRKSPYLSGLPLLSINPQTFIHQDYLPKYQLRSSEKINQLCTAEVAAQVLAVAGELENARILDSWFDVYSYQYQKSVCQTNKGDPQAQQRYESLVQEYNN